MSESQDDLLTARRTHDWFKPEKVAYECCRNCGIVRRLDGKNKPVCVGKVFVGLRDRVG